MQANSTEGALKPRIIHHADGFVVACKPAGMPVQADTSGDPDLLSWVQQELNEPGLQLVNRIDRPVSGLVLVAVEGPTLVAANLAFHQQAVRKVYLAIVEGSVSGGPELILEHHLIHDVHARRARVVVADAPQAKVARLQVRVLNRGERYTLLKVLPEGGRFHQIRAQLAAWGHPIKGDVKYGARRGEKDRSIALHAYRLTLPADLTDGQLSFTATPPDVGLWAKLLPGIDVDHIGSTSVTN